MSLVVTRAHTSEPDPSRAVSEVAQALGAPTSAVLFFASPSYDSAALAAALEGAFACPVIGCTSSGQLGPTGFQRGGITAVGLSHPELTLTPHLLSPLSASSEQVSEIARAVQLRRAGSVRRPFGLLLVDGLSLMEERLAAALYQALGDLPIIGGSAGDDLAFERTAVYHEGKFLSDAAVFTLFETSLPFATFKLQHFATSERKVVVTAAHVHERRVLELNGEPAADVYAEVLGLRRDELGPGVFSRHPLVLRVGGDDYVRSIQKLHPDGSFSLFCAIDEGVVLSVGECLDALDVLRGAFDRVADAVPEPALVLGCDCILRRLEFEETGLDRRVGDFLAERSVLGFSTYGEQYNGLHVNQTFTGVAIGGG
ncbi:MAG: FIST C-terminal domain-containing protein [Polyangiaceae bacterium]|nr:FIST C-terminal domain-containing protein [Polyangiaceae bacterium]